LPISDCSVNAAVSGARYVGGIAGYFSSSGNAVDNCRTQGSVSGGNGSSADVGGIVGKLYNGNIRRCTSTAAINATGDYAGGIVGSTYLSTLIEKSSAAGNVSSTYSYVGGIVGELYFSSIIFCQTSGAVQGLDYVGGITGKVIGNLSQVTDCVATGDVSGKGRVGGAIGWLVVNSGTATLTRCGADNFNVTTQAAYGGGLIGDIQANSPGTVVISHCFAYPDVTCNGPNNNDRRYQAGLAGSALRTTITNSSAWGSVYNGYQSTGGLVGSMANCTVTNCYSIGNPSGVADVGGLIGNATTCTVTNSFWDQWTSGEPTGAWGTPKTTTEMRLRSTFTGWDFVGETANGTSDYWRMCTEGINYPKLTWELIQNGDFACPDIVAMEDFAYLAARWLRNDCVITGNCEGADLNHSGDIEINDLITFAANWLEGV
jgi:hypothetical protein